MRILWTFCWYDFQSANELGRQTRGFKQQGRFLRSDNIMRNGGKTYGSVAIVLLALLVRHFGCLECPSRLERSWIGLILREMVSRFSSRNGLRLKRVL